jgi:hypothetical protein
MSINIDTERWVHWPYCIQRVTEGRYVLLNRRYKPIGNPTTEFVEDYSPWAFDLDLKPEQSRQLAFDQDESVRCVYFYGDGCIPNDTPAFMRANRSRLSVLAAIGGPDLTHIGARA